MQSVFSWSASIRMLISLSIPISSSITLHHTRKAHSEERLVFQPCHFTISTGDLFSFRPKGTYSCESCATLTGRALNDNCTLPYWSHFVIAILWICSLNEPCHSNSAYQFWKSIKSEPILLKLIQSNELFLVYPIPILYHWVSQLTGNLLSFPTLPSHNCTCNTN